MDLFQTLIKYCSLNSEISFREIIILLTLRISKW
jgi:hypothetical protein